MTDKFSKGATIPTSIGLCADMLKETQDLRLAMQKEVDAVAEREREIREHIIANLSKSEDTGAAGKRYRAQIVTKTVPAAKDWEKIHQFVLETERFDLLQKRLSDKAVAEMWESGAEVPGVERFNSVSVSITKI